MDGCRRPPTIRDVAAAANVSPSTVSHAFSGRRAISEETRQRVMKAARELGYHANPHARSMRTGKTGMIGFILRPHLIRSGSLEIHETFNRLTGAVAVACLREGIGLVHIPTVDDELLEMLPMDGCIVAYPNTDDPVLEELLRRGVPVVTADPDPGRPGICPQVKLDYDSGFGDMLETLVVAPGDEVWLMLGAESNAWTVTSGRVIEEWARAEGLILHVHRATGEVGVADARETMIELLSSRQPPRVIIYGRADLTGPVVSQLHEHGLRIPEDVQIAALTDSVHARISPVPVTTVDLSHEALAQAAVSQMLRMLEDPASRPDPIVVRPLLRRRDSTLGVTRRSR